MSPNIIAYQTPIKILYVDDDPDDKEFFQEALEKLSLNHKLQLAGDYDEMISILEAGPLPQIIFLDLNLPGNDGIQCLKELKEHITWRTIPVVIFSTNQNQAIIRKVFDMGAHYYIVKPYAQINFIVSLAIIFSYDWRQPQLLPQRQYFVIDNTFSVEDNLHKG